MSKQERLWLVLGSAYAVCVVIIGGYFNYTVPYSSDPTTTPTLIQGILWSMLYLPLLIFPLFAKWEIKPFGFSVNPFAIMGGILVIAICTITARVQGSWITGFWEAFARTGEEIFFRGFVFAGLRARYDWLYTWKPPEMAVPFLRHW